MDGMDEATYRLSGTGGKGVVSSELGGGLKGVYWGYIRIV